MVTSSGAKKDTSHSTKIKRELRTLKQPVTSRQDPVMDFTAEEMNTVLQNENYPPGKPEDQPENYRPVALYSVTFKLLERRIYNRLNPTTLRTLRGEQAGYQIVADFTEAYDTIWRKRMYQEKTSSVAHIQPPKLRSQNSQGYQTICNNLDLPIHGEIIEFERLKSRKPSVKTHQTLISNNFNSWASDSRTTSLSPHSLGRSSCWPTTVRASEAMQDADERRHRDVSSQSS
ncbi:hypothetical protein ILUMI_06643 [Ignelater luminosus]|uniref:Uncharacterized protein n=1 Tax=Ignelater luminosus TaxID=2038154 RepID=A0A8K0GF57_IGNLU|nr:hypothetical protein ILUMI_06643 [Ignelater luminosus]